MRDLWKDSEDLRFKWGQGQGNGGKEGRHLPKPRIHEKAL